MKRKFNFYCILLLIAVAFSLFTAAQHFVEGFNSGYADATLAQKAKQQPDIAIIPRARPANPTFWTCVRTTRHAANWR